MDKPSRVPSICACAKRGELKQVRLLVRKGYLNEIDEDGNSALIHASSGNHVPIVELLLDKGCWIDQANKLGNTALHIAANKGVTFVTTVKMLLEADANYRLKNKEGKCALDHMRKHHKLINHPMIASLLIAKSKLKSEHHLKRAAVCKDIYVKRRHNIQLQIDKKYGTMDSKDPATRSQIENVRGVFEAMTGGNPYLKADDISSLLKFIGAKPTALYTRSFFDLLDTNKDGKVDFEDFWMAMRWPRVPIREDADAVDRVFALIDADNDGVVTRNEYREVQQLLGPWFHVEGKEVNRIFSRISPDTATKAESSISSIDKKTLHYIVESKTDAT